MQRRQHRLAQHLRPLPSQQCWCGTCHSKLGFHTTCQLFLQVLGICRPCAPPHCRTPTATLSLEQAPPENSGLYQLMKSSRTLMSRSRACGPTSTLVSTASSGSSRLMFGCSLPAGARRQDCQVHSEPRHACPRQALCSWAGTFALSARSHGSREPKKRIQVQRYYDNLSTHPRLTHPCLYALLCSGCATATASLAPAAPRALDSHKDRRAGRLKFS